MSASRLLVVWEYDAGVRAGFAMYRGEPHYFEQQWDGTEYINRFKVKPVTLDVVRWAKEVRDAVDEWDKLRMQGKADYRDRPDMPGPNPKCWKLRSRVEEFLQATPPLRDDLVLIGSVPTQGRDMVVGLRTDVLIEWRNVA